MATLLPALFAAAPAASAAGAAAPALGAAAAPAFFGGATPAIGAAAAPAVTAATPALAGAAAPSILGTAGAMQAAPVLGNNLGISYGQLMNLAGSKGNTSDFAPLVGSVSNTMAQQRGQMQGPTMQGLPVQQDPDTLERILAGFRNIGSM